MRDAQLPGTRLRYEDSGGEGAPDLVKRILVSRNNTAVAEAEFMMKLFTENVGAEVPAAPAAPGR